MFALEDLIKVIDPQTALSVIIRRKEEKYGRYSYWPAYNGSCLNFYQLDEEKAKLFRSIYRINTVFENIKDLEVVEINVRALSDVMQVCVEEKKNDSV